MNKAIFAFVCSSVISTSAFSAVTVDYRNFDSREHIFAAKCSGSSASFTFEGNTTGAATAQGSAPCLIENQGEQVQLRGGEKVEIKDGRIRVL